LPTSTIKTSLTKAVVTGIGIGFLFFLIDLFFLGQYGSVQHPVLLFVSAIVVLLGVGCLFGLLVYCLENVLLFISRRFLPQLPTHVTFALLSVIVALIPLAVLGRKLFSGTGVSKTSIAQAGPYLFVLLALGVIFLWILMVRSPRKRSNTVFLVGIPMVSGLTALGCIWADNHLYVHYYTYLHNVLWLLSAGSDSQQ